ncbi:sulfatase-like hydrolase/transferase [Mariniflexile sp. AS56]|uniref:sulfatase-like hydrolase/transferase n=1 Tax=Mariniflexile sp. AS56 TaxID=3063957 RepID=UPI0026EA7CF8|nr:sulfatase-like hydrolase/transferase [Mariniflexile sp. AS56]MDO7173150.1 sulfatase-like hydrolase/transferase [Mariniflexile sp. AS56]
MTNSNYFRLIFLIATIGFSTLKSHSQNTKKPNVIWIITDEHNFRTLGCYRDQLTADQAFQWGSTAFAETPNIDSLAENGTIFNRMYASAAVCTPSRASMFTGIYPTTLGIPNNSNKKGDGKYLKEDVTTIADVLSNAGYFTGYSGKWHLAESRDESGDKDRDEWWSPYPVGHPEDHYGFQDTKFMFLGGHDKFKGIDAEGNPYRADKNVKLIGTDTYGQPLFEDSKSKNVKHTTDWLADRTIEFIDAHKETPFYYVVSIPDPHTPDTVRAPYDAMFTNVDIKLPATYDFAFKNKDNEVLPKWQKPDGKTKNPEKLKKEIQQYLGMVKLIDDNVGRIIQKLKDDGIFENTIIVFSSDHGDLLGEHGRVNKGTIHEASAKIPFVMAQGSTGKSPIVPRGLVVNKAANNTDWMPTFLSMLNVDCPKVAGRDLTPLLAKKLPADWNDVTFTKLGYYAAISEQYKLVVEVKGDTWLLDIKADPNEIVNYINDPKYSLIIKKLAKDLKGYMKANKDNNKAIAEKLDALI